MTEDLRQELERVLAGRSMPDRRILFVGILNKHLPPPARAVLVGGALVEFYTTGAYVTGDVDLVADRGLVANALGAAGFQQEGRFFFRDDLGIVAEVPSSRPRATETVREPTFEGYAIPSVSLEDAIVDRLLTAKFWRSPTDWEQAVLLAAAQVARVDKAALRQKAKANDVLDRAEELLAAVAGAAG